MWGNPTLFHWGKSIENWEKINNGRNYWLRKVHTDTINSENLFDRPADPICNIPWFVNGKTWSPGYFWRTLSIFYAYDQEVSKSWLSDSTMEPWS